jgi:hypothetical protein
MLNMHLPVVPLRAEAMLHKVFGDMLRAEPSEDDKNGFQGVMLRRGDGGHPYMLTLDVSIAHLLHSRKPCPTASWGRR